MRLKIIASRRGRIFLFLRGPGHFKMAAQIFGQGVPQGRGLGVLGDCCVVKPWLKDVLHKLPKWSKPKIS